MAEENTPQKELTYDFYLDALTDGAARSRTIMTFLLIGSFLAFVALVNSFGSDLNWFQSRMAAHREASNWITFFDESHTGRHDSLIFPGESRIQLNAFEPSEFFMRIREVYGGDLQHNGASLRSIDLNKKEAEILNSKPNYLFKFPSNTIHLGTREVIPQRLSPDRYTNVIQYLQTASPNSAKEFNEIMARLQRANIEHRMIISIPIIGLSIDVNNLCWATGIAFGIFYFLLAFSLSREKKNLLLTFTIGLEQGFRMHDIYRLISMRQVLTIPPSIDEYLSKPKTLLERSEDKPSSALQAWDFLRNRRLKRVAQLIPLVFPVLVWIGVFIYDIISSRLGSSINPTLLTIDTVFSVLNGAAMGFFAYHCWLYWVSIERDWVIYSKSAVWDQIQSRSQLAESNQ